MMRVVLNRTARLIGKLAEVDLERVRRGAKHVDVCAGAKNSWLQTGNYHRAYFRGLEAQTLNRIGEFDVNAQVVGIEFKFVTLIESVVFGNVHRQGSDCAADIELPVMILVR